MGRHSLSGIRGMSTSPELNFFYFFQSRHSLSGIRGMSTELMIIANDGQKQIVAIPCRELGGCQHSCSKTENSYKGVAIPCRELGGCQHFPPFKTKKYMKVAIPCRELGGCQQNILLSGTDNFFPSPFPVGN